MAQTRQRLEPLAVVEFVVVPNQTTLVLALVL